MAYAAATGTIVCANATGSMICRDGVGVTVTNHVPAKYTSQITEMASSQAAVCAPVPAGTLSTNQLVRVSPSYDVDLTRTMTTAGSPGNATTLSRPSSGLRSTTRPSLRRRP